MQRVLVTALGVGFVLVGPVMFVLSRSAALNAAVAHLRPGEQVAAVRVKLGPPAGCVRSARGTQVCRYTVWPLPGAWAVEFSTGRLVAVRRRGSRWQQMRRPSHTVQSLLRGTAQEHSSPARATVR